MRDPGRCACLRRAEVGAPAYSGNSPPSRPVGDLSSEGLLKRGCPDPSTKPPRGCTCTSSSPHRRAASSSHRSSASLRASARRSRISSRRARSWIARATRSKRLSASFGVCSFLRTFTVPSVFVSTARQSGRPSPTKGRRSFAPNIAARPWMFLLSSFLRSLRACGVRKRLRGPRRRVSDVAPEQWTNASPIGFAHPTGRGAHDGASSNVARRSSTRPPGTSAAIVTLSSMVVPGLATLSRPVYRPSVRSS